MQSRAVAVGGDERLDVGDINIRQPGHVLQDAFEIPLDLRGLLVGQFKPGKCSYVADLWRPKLFRGAHGGGGYFGGGPAGAA